MVLVCGCSRLGSDSAVPEAGGFFDNVTDGMPGRRPIGAGAAAAGGLAVLAEDIGIAVETDETGTAGRPDKDVRSIGSFEEGTRENSMSVKGGAPESVPLESITSLSVAVVTGTPVAIFAVSVGVPIPIGAVRTDEPPFFIIWPSGFAGEDVGFNVFLNFGDAIVHSLLLSIRFNEMVFAGSVPGMFIPISGNGAAGLFSFFDRKLLLLLPAMPIPDGG